MCGVWADADLLSPEDVPRQPLSEVGDQSTGTQESCAILPIEPVLAWPIQDAAIPGGFHRHRLPAAPRSVVTCPPQAVRVDSQTAIRSDCHETAYSPAPCPAPFGGIF